MSKKVFLNALNGVKSLRSKIYFGLIQNANHSLWSRLSRIAGSYGCRMKEREGERERERKRAREQVQMKERERER